MGTPNSPRLPSLRQNMHSLTTVPFMPSSVYRLTLASILLSLLALVFALAGDLGGFSYFTVPTAAFLTLVFHLSLLGMVRHDHRLRVSATRNDSGNSGNANEPKCRSVANWAYALFLGVVWLAAGAVTIANVVTGTTATDDQELFPPSKNPALGLQVVEIIFTLGEAVVLGVYVGVEIRLRRSFKRKDGPWRLVEG